jgi:hypothetical protein
MRLPSIPKQLLFILFIAATMSSSSVLSQSLGFQTFKNNQEIYNTGYRLKINQDLKKKTVKIEISKQDQHFTLHEFPLIYDDVDDLGMARIDRNNKIFIVTKLNGGSGEFYFHRLIKIENQKIYDKGDHVTCGEPELKNNQLIFTAHKFKCRDSSFEPDNEAVSEVVALE